MEQPTVRVWKAVRDHNYIADRHLPYHFVTSYMSGKKIPVIHGPLGSLNGKRFFDDRRAQYEEV